MISPREYFASEPFLKGDSTPKRLIFFFGIVLVVTTLHFLLSSFYSQIFASLEPAINFVLPVAPGVKKAILIAAAKDELILAKSIHQVYGSLILIALTLFVVFTVISIIEIRDYISNKTAFFVPNKHADSPSEAYAILKNVTFKLALGTASFWGLNVWFLLFSFRSKFFTSGAKLFFYELSVCFIFLSSAALVFHLQTLINLKKLARS